MKKDQFGELPRGINHIGLTVPNLDQAASFFKKALGAEYVYDGLTSDDAPRKGKTVELQLGLSEGSKIIRQRLLRIGNSANLELFEIVSDKQAQPSGLQDLGWNHISIFVDDIETAMARAKAAGAQFLSEVHENSKHEDTPGNASIYFATPWGSLVELQSIPNGYDYPENSAAKTWIPEK
ncbi:MAG: VOC family protein [Sporolactobacillus sp.]